VAIAPLIIIWVETFLALLGLRLDRRVLSGRRDTTVGLNSADRNLMAVVPALWRLTRTALRYLKLPTALPYFLAGLRTAVGSR